jgi:hypothetical protein
MTFKRDKSITIEIRDNGYTIIRQNGVMFAHTINKEAAYQAIYQKLKLTKPITDEDFKN